MLKSKFPLLFPSVEAPNMFLFGENSRLLGPVEDINLFLFCRRRQKKYTNIWKMYAEARGNHWKEYKYVTFFGSKWT